MESIFINILVMSLTAGCVTAAVLLARLFLKKAPKKYSYLLWAAVAFRLVCPCSFGSDISIFNLKLFDLVKNAEYAAVVNTGETEVKKQYSAGGKAGLAENGGEALTNIPDMEAAAVTGESSGKMYTILDEFYGKSDTALGEVYGKTDTAWDLTSDTAGMEAAKEAADNMAVNDKADYFPDGQGNEKIYQDREAPGAMAGSAVRLLVLVWLSGVLVMAVYGALSYTVLKCRLGKALRIQEDVYRSDRISTPFVIGIISPKIYIPCFLDNTSAKYVIMHEKCHIRRRDYIVKLFAFTLLAIHWFNPLVWTAFVCMGRDMEMSCDESVVARMDSSGNKEVSAANKAYSYALLNCASAGRFPAPGPLCFGDISVKGRIKNVLNYRKPKKAVNVLAMLLCMLVLAACSADPRSVEGTDSADKAMSIDGTSEPDEIQTYGTMNVPEGPDTDGMKDIPEGMDAGVTVYLPKVYVTGNKMNISEESGKGGTMSAGDESGMNEAAGSTMETEPTTSSAVPAELKAELLGMSKYEFDDYFDIFETCAEYKLDPQELYDVIIESLDTGYFSPYTQCKSYMDDMDEWKRKMTAYYGEDWEVLIPLAYMDVKDTSDYEEEHRSIAHEYEGVRYCESEYYRDIRSEISSRPEYPMPVENAELTSEFGTRELTTGQVVFHPEEDYAVKLDSEVHAAAEGTVLVADWAGSAGWCIYIQHDDGYVMQYSHLSSMKVEPGDRVKSGDIIALSGCSGDATGPMIGLGISFYDEEGVLNFVEPRFVAE